MRITAIHVRRYRAFDRQVSIPISNLTVITGPNNQGKSTVLSALDLFFGVFQPRSSFGMSKGQRYAYSNDYPKRYVGRAGRRWPTSVAIDISLTDADRAAITQAVADDFPSHVTTQVEFQWNETYEDFRPRISVVGVDNEDRVAAFITWLKTTVRYVYIPAARNVHDLRRGVFSELLAGALSRVRRSRQRLQAIESFLADVAAEVALVEGELVAELQHYLPAVRGLNFKVSDLDLDNLVSLQEVQIDDGALTPLQQKGDGFKSLFAISLLQYIARQRFGSNLIFGIEEPEAHLHSSAIYEIKETLRNLAETFQVIATTHSPILIQRDDIASNILVESAGGDAFSSITRPARNLADIRRSLGIRPHENMTTAQVILVVEGPTEETAIPALISRRSERVLRSLRSGQVRVLPAGGAANIPAVVRALARDATTCLVFADSDNAGDQALNRIRTSGLIQPADLFRAPARDGCPETEFEDLFDPEIYLEALGNATGLMLNREEFEACKRRSGGHGARFAKWSVVMQRAANDRGLVWDAIEDHAKSAVAAAIATAAPHIEVDQIPWAQTIAERIDRYLTEAGI